MTWDYLSYRISEHFLSALINADYSGLTDEEEKQFNLFIDDACRSASRLEGFMIGHWDYEEGSENFRVCEVTGLYSSVVTVNLHVYKVTE